MVTAIITKRVRILTTTFFTKGERVTGKLEGRTLVAMSKRTGKKVWVGPCCFKLRSGKKLVGRSRSIEQFFANMKTGKVMATLSELLAAGFSLQQIDNAVKAERLRRGISGYWIPQGADPGLITVLNNLSDND